MYAHDGASPVTYWVHDWPRSQVYCTALAPLLGDGSHRRSFGLIIEPLSPRTAEREVMRERTARHVAIRMRQRTGQIVPEHEQAAMDRARAQDADRAAGHGLARFTAYVAVTVADQAQLEDACAAMEADAAAALIEICRMWFAQDAGFAMGALPLGFGLPKRRWLLCPAMPPPGCPSSTSPPTSAVPPYLRAPWMPPPDKTCRPPTACAASSSATSRTNTVRWPARSVSSRSSGPGLHARLNPLDAGPLGAARAVFTPAAGRGTDLAAFLRAGPCRDAADMLWGAATVKIILGGLAGEELREISELAGEYRETLTTWQRGRTDHSRAATGSGRLANRPASATGGAGPGRPAPASG